MRERGGQIAVAWEIILIWAAGKSRFVDEILGERVDTCKRQRGIGKHFLYEYM